MLRQLAAMTAVLAWLALLPLPAATQEATPTQPVLDSGALLELPALVLTPRDLEAAGFPGFGLSVSTLALGPDLIASTLFFQRLDEPQMRLLAEQLQAVGAQRAYAAWLGTVDPSPGETTRDVIVSIDEYADSAGADQGLEILTIVNDVLDPTAQAITGTRTFGEDSQIILYGQASDPWLDMQIRLGAMNVGIAIIDYTGQIPEVAEIEALAGALLTKIERERAEESPGLSVHGLRLTPAVYSFDSYVRRDGTGTPYAEESEEARQLREATYGPAADVYIVGQFLAPADSVDFESAPRVQNVLARFPNESAAAQYLTDLPDILGANPDFAEVAVRENATQVGDESVAVTYTAVGPDGGPVYLDRVAIREGALVTTVIVRTLGDVPRAATVDALAEAAFDCLHGEGWCPPFPAPSELLPSERQTMDGI
jgi:hypothetical protein